MCSCGITYCRQNRQNAQTPSVSAIEWLAPDKLSCCFQVLRRWTESNGNSLMPGSCRLSRLCHRNQAECRLPLAKVLSSNARLHLDCRQTAERTCCCNMSPPCISCISNSSLKASQQQQRPPPELKGAPGRRRAAINETKQQCMCV